MCCYSSAGCFRAFLRCTRTSVLFRYFSKRCLSRTRATWCRTPISSSDGCVQSRHIDSRFSRGTSSNLQEQKGPFRFPNHQRTFHSASQIASTRSVPHSCLHASVSAGSDIQTRGSKKCTQHSLKDHVRGCLPSKDGLQLALQWATGSGTGRI